MSQRELSETSIEWVTGVAARQARIFMDGDTGAITIDGVSVLVNGSPVSGLVFQGTWSAIVSYAVGALVTGSDGDLYVSIQDPNLNHNPVTPSPTFWTKVVDVPTFVDATFTASAAGTVPATAKGFAAQTAHLFDFSNSAGTPLAAIDAAGNVILAPNIVAALGAVVLVAGAVPAVFPNGRSLVAGNGISFDDSVAGVRTVNTSAGGPTVVEANIALSTGLQDLVPGFTMAAGQKAMISGLIRVDGLQSADAFEIAVTKPSGGDILSMGTMMDGTNVLASVAGANTLVLPPIAGGQTAMAQFAFAVSPTGAGLVTVQVRNGTGVRGTVIKGSSVTYIHSLV